MSVWRSDTFNVVDFGADPTGQSDSTAAINLAIAAASVFRGPAQFASSGRVWFPRGAYVTQGGHRVQAHAVLLEGEGRGNVGVFNQDPTVDTFYFGLANPQNNEKIFGAGIKSMQLWQEGADPAQGAHINLDRAAAFLGQDLNLFNHYEGVRFAGTGESCRLDHVDITQGSNTTALQTGSTGLKITRREVDSTDPLAVEDPNDPGVFYTEPNSIYLDNMNIRSNGFGAQFCVDVDALDGLYANGNHHWGFADTAILRFRQSQQNLGINNVRTGGVFFDGQDTDYGIFYQRNPNLTENTVLSHEHVGAQLGGFNRSGVLIQGEQSNRPRRIAFNGGEIKGAEGIAMDIQAGKGISTQGMHFFNNSGPADIHARGGSDLSFMGNVHHGGPNIGLQTSDAISPVSRVSAVGNHYDPSYANPQLLTHADTASDQIGLNVT